MVPAISSGGKTFKAAALYFLHDRKPDGGQAATAHRVAWAETFNLATDDPHRAWRIMADTADPLTRAELKAAAGIKATGRKLERPTFAFSLSWHLDEQPTKAEQIEAAREALRALGLEDHQALILAHTDAAHPHVHVLCNRIDPNTGRAAKLAKSKLVLSAWAQAYEERQGRIRCVARVENNARRADPSLGRASDNRRRRAHRAELAADPRRLDAASLRRQHAETFGNQAAKEAHGARRRVREVDAFRADHRQARQLIATQTAMPRLDAAQAQTQARLSALLASDRPAQALDALTRDRSTFTRAELERFVIRHTSDLAAYRDALARLDASQALMRVGTDRLGRVRYTTVGHHAIEGAMFAAAEAMHQRPGDAVPARFKGWTLSGDQEAALLHVLGPARFAAVEGVAGSGKSTMLHAARQSWERARLRVYGMALAAEAAEGLQQGSGIPSTTVQRRLFLWEQGRALPQAGDVVVVDEAGMLGSRQMERIIHHCAQGGAKLVLVGGTRQLQAIEAGGAFRALCDRYRPAVLTTVRRQRADWQREATTELAGGHAAAALARYEANGHVHGHATDDAARAALVDAWHRHGLAKPDQSQLMLAYLRRDVAALNALARARMRQDGALGPDIEVATATGPLAFATGDRIAFTRNDTRMAVRNGSLGAVTAIEGRRVTVRLDGKPPRTLTFSLDDYDHLAHGYAATIHKSQGATVDRAHLFCSNNLDQHAAYVAMTRHRDQLDVHWSRQSIPSRARLAAIIGREAMKDTSYDYTDEAAQEIPARREAAAAMHERIRARAAAFAERETTRRGRVENARRLLPATANGLQIGRLARNAPLRARLFRHRQNRLRDWARKVAPATAEPGAAPLLPPAATRADRRAAALLDHMRDSVARFAGLTDRHAAEREAERLDRQALGREAARTWQGETLKARSGDTQTPYSYRDHFWTAAAHPPASNDNGPDAPTPFRPRPA